jgi:hypothetical protein
VPYDNSGPVTTLVYGTDFVIRDQDGDYSLGSQLEALAGTWMGLWIRPPTRLASTRGPDSGRYRVTYTAGWNADEVPFELMEAGMMEAAARWARRKKGEFYQSESLNGYSYSMAQGNKGNPEAAKSPFVSDAAYQMLEPYILPQIAIGGNW